MLNSMVDEDPKAWLIGRILSALEIKKKEQQYMMREVERLKKQRDPGHARRKTFLVFFVRLKYMALYPE